MTKGIGGLLGALFTLKLTEIFVNKADNFGGSNSNDNGFDIIK